MAEGKMKKKQVVFEGDDSEEPITLSVNETYKKRFEETERKREINYLTSKGLLNDNSDDSNSSDDSSEDEMSDDEANMKLDKLLNNVMTSIRKKDPKIFDKDTKWFKDDKDEDDEEGVKPKKGKKAKEKAKKMTYKDVIREQILEDASTLGYAKPTLNGESDEEDARNREDNNYNNDMSSKNKKKGLAYDEEQLKLRQAFISGVNEDEDDEDNSDKNDNDDNELLAVKKKNNKSKQDDDDDDEDSDEDDQFEVLNGEDTTDKFLKDFLTNKRWKETNIIGDDESDDDEVDDDEDLDEVDAMEAFESKYNFRFEEEEANKLKLLSSGDDDFGDVSNIAPSMRGHLIEANSGDKVRSYSRQDVSGTLRRKDEKRKIDRENRKERKANEKLKIEEELRRLKNLKKKEIEKKLNEITEYGGIDYIDPSMLEGDFDPESFDKAMQSMYGDDYYNDSNLDTKLKVENDENDDEDEDDDDDDDDDEGGGDKKVMKEHKEWSKEMSKKGAEAKQLMEEMSKFEYDDIIDDTPTRFRYTSVQPESYGLTTEEILQADDNALNAFVSLKKVAAPYGYTGNVPVNARKRKKFRENLKLQKSEEIQLTQPHVETGEVKKKRKRRRGKNKKDGDDDDGYGDDNGDGDNEEVRENVEEKEEEETFEKKKTKKSSSVETVKEETVVKKKKKNNKDKKKENKVKLVEGVSASRLAAYGIA